MTSLAGGHLRLRHFRVLLAVLVLATAALAWALIARPGSGFTPSFPPGSNPAASGAPTGAAVPSSLEPSLARLAASAPQRRVQVIIQVVRGVDPARGASLVSALGGHAGPVVPIINGLSAQMTARAAARLAASHLIHAVSLNTVLKSTSLPDGLDPWALDTTFDQSTGAARLWRRSTGQGVGVAVIDTGIDGDLPDFRTSQSDTTSRVIASAVIDPNASTADDTYGHGTAVAGVIAGNGEYRDPGDPEQGEYAGTAPDANLIAIKVADDTGASTTLDAIYGLQFAVDHKDAYNIGVINMSFRSTAAQSYTTDPLDAAAEQAWFDGIVVVAAAGNLGTDPDAVDYAPGNDPYVLTVGAVDEQGTPSPWDDVQASWSSQGTTQDGIAKPDVLAPGAHIVTTLAPNSDFATLCPSCIVQNDYFQVSGTSLAAPIVAGIAADLVAAHPNWTPEMVKGAIVNTATQLPSGGVEVNGDRADWAYGRQLISDQGLTPNQLIDPDTGTIDYSAASWSAGDWTPATDPLAASWSAASWSCESCSSPDGSGGSSVSPTSASWSTVGWTTMWG
ncbi:MAG TPA: S8 family peptidase [Solirubrobacteraceae bacterium]|jgi:serine protease AprX|nr:S8 family peptidase [Solirubrobacteraceae bacterium]